MVIGAELAGQALIETLRHLFAAVPGGWTRGGGGALAAVTGVALPTLNGVWVEQLDADGDLVGDLLDAVASTGLPYCLQLRPGARPRLAELATRRGMSREEDVPLMALQDAGALGVTQTVNRLVIRELEPAEALLHASVAAAGFEAPAELFQQLMTPEVLSAPGVRCYLGEAAGQPVTTGFGVTLRTFVAIFNIATPPAHRGRGYGAAVTARAVSDGLAAGARWSWLQTSPAGHKIYESLGFRTVERWQCWLGAATDRPVPGTASPQPL